MQATASADCSLAGARIARLQAMPQRRGIARSGAHQRWKSEVVSWWSLLTTISMSAAPPSILKKTC
jgi:hypothetical protein